MIDDRDENLRAEFDRLRLEVDRIAQEAQDADGLAMMGPQGGRGIPEWVPGGGGGRAEPRPFQVLPQGGLGIKLHPGTVNGFDPVYSGTALSDNPTITLPDNATTHVFVKVDLTPGPSAATVKYLYKVDAPVTVDIGASTPADTGTSYGDTAGTAYWRVARVVTSGGQVTDPGQDWTGHLWHVWSNGGHLWAGRPG